MSRKMLIKPFRSIESAATATHNWRRRQILKAGASTLVLGLAAPRTGIEKSPESSSRSSPDHSS